MSELWEDRFVINISKNFLMDGALQRWGRIALVHFQSCSDLVGEAANRGRVKPGKGVCDFQVIVKVLPTLEIL